MENEAPNPGFAIPFPIMGKGVEMFNKLWHFVIMSKK